MKPGKILLAFACALGAVAAFATLPAMAQEKKPNIVFILMDNLGYGELAWIIHERLELKRRDHG